jgi:hypothetical protein
VVVCNVRGVALIGQGKLDVGCDWLERGIEKCRQLQDAAARAEFIIDPEVSMRLNVAFPLVNRGLADRARKHMALGAERAHRIGEPMSVMLSYWCGGMVAARLQEYEDLARNAASMAKVVESTMLPQAMGPSLWLQGLADAHLGRDPRAAHRMILEGYECHARLGMYGGCTEVLGYATQASILAGDCVGARRQVTEALGLAERIGERVALPELHLLKARIELQSGELDAGRASMEASLRESQMQGALGYELQVLTALVEAPNSRPEDLAALLAAHSKMVEGRDTKAYRRASAVLAARGGC